jgi:transposase
VALFLERAKPCLVAIEVYGGFHHWVRLPQQYCHTVKDIPQKHIKPFITKQKIDANDAIGVTVAANRSSIPIFLIKSVEQ